MSNFLSLKFFYGVFQISSKYTLCAYTLTAQVMVLLFRETVRYQNICKTGRFNNNNKMSQLSLLDWYHRKS